MSVNAGDPPDDPPLPEDLGTLEAELRAALQHQRAAVARVQETQAEMDALLRRARELLSRGEGPGNER